MDNLLEDRKNGGAGCNYSTHGSQSAVMEPRYGRVGPACGYRHAGFQQSRILARARETATPGEAGTLATSSSIFTLLSCVERRKAKLGAL